MIERSAGGRSRRGTVTPARYCIRAGKMIAATLDKLPPVLAEIHAPQARKSDDAGLWQFRSASWPSPAAPRVTVSSEYKR